MNNRKISKNPQNKTIIKDLVFFSVLAKQNKASIFDFCHRPSFPTLMLSKKYNDALDSLTNVRNLYNDPPLIISHAWKVWIASQFFRNAIYLSYVTVTFVAVKGLKRPPHGTKPSGLN